MGISVFLLVVAGLVNALAVAITRNKPQALSLPETITQEHVALDPVEVVNLVVKLLFKS